MKYAIIATARAYLAKRPAPYSCPEEEVAFIEAYVYGWLQDHSKEPELTSTDWPAAYLSGFNEGWHRRDKVSMQ